MSMRLLEEFDANQKASRQRQEHAHASAFHPYVPPGETEAEAIAQHEHTEKETRENEAEQEHAGSGLNITPTGVLETFNPLGQGTTQLPQGAASAGANLRSGELTGPAGSVPHSGQIKEEGEGAVNKAKTVAKAPLEWAQALGKILTKLLEPEFWLRILKFLLGLVALIIAIVLFARAAGLGAPNPVTAATQSISKQATGNYQSQRQVSPGTRQQVTAARRRESKQDRTERSKTGKPLAGGALTSRQRARIRQRDRTLPSTRQLRKTVKRK